MVIVRGAKAMMAGGRDGGSVPASRPLWLNTMIRFIHKITNRICVKHCVKCRRTGKSTRLGRAIFRFASAVEFKLRKKKANGGHSYYEAPNA